jgi:foldase protein PrsA
MLAKEGLKNGLDKDPEVTRQLNLMRENLIANAQIGRIEKGITISDADLQKAYEANKNQYEQLKARHILVAFKGSPAADPEKPELTEEQAKAKAEEIRKQLVAGGSWDEIAKKESDGKGSGARGGDLGSFGRGQMVDEFETAAFAAKAGDVTPVVRTQFGYHVIKVDEKKTTSFAEVKEQLEKAERQKKMQEVLDSMKNTAKVTFNDSYFGASAPAAVPPPAQ